MIKHYAKTNLIILGKDTHTPMKLRERMVHIESVHIDHTGINCQLISVQFS